MSAAATTNAALERLADAVTERLLPRLVSELADLLERQSHPPELVDAGELARSLGVSADFVYRHADRLGAVRLGEQGEGKRPRLRFDVARARAAQAEEAIVDERPADPQTRRRRPVAARPGSVLSIRDGETAT